MITNVITGDLWCGKNGVIYCVSMTAKTCKDLSEIFCLSEKNTRKLVSLYSYKRYNIDD